MILKFFDRDDEANELNGITVRDSRHLRQVLEAQTYKQPFVCELVGENGFQLTIGVGKLGCVQYARCDGSPPYLMAVSGSRAMIGADKEFMLGGTPSSIPARFCMPFEEVIEIAVYFMETGKACPSFSWEQ